MSRVNQATRIARSTIPCMLLALVFGCGDAGTTPVYSGPGTGGTGGSGGASGSGGTGGTGAIGGSGGISGTGGTVGSGGTGGTGGLGGSGGVVTKSICFKPPVHDLCGPDRSCALGYVCVDSGCKTDEGVAIKQCQTSRGISCADKACPSADYDCIALALGGGGERCVRRPTTGCDLETETYDCPPGFSCEGKPGDEACVDRRMPCDGDGDLDCPKSHVCTTTQSSRYCIRTHRTCRLNEDCWAPLAAGSFCADVDDDGTKECVGGYNNPLKACVNADCPGSAPVCESGSEAASVSCGDYGLCFDDRDCGAGFSCVGLWQDGRKECVQTPIASSCHKVTDCPLQQVCAAPRGGGPPSCQSGSAPP
jgi:hypothetical protein